METKEPTVIANLLPRLQTLTTSTAGESAPSSYWTSEELGRAKRASIVRALKAGWKYEGGWLIKGHARMRPGELMPSKFGTPMFNPRTDAFALRMGATYVAPGRYRLGQHMVDAMGQFVDREGCPACGRRAGDPRPGQVRTENPNPFAKPYEQTFTYCRRCTTPEEVARLKGSPAMKEKP